MQRAKRSEASAPAHTIFFFLACCYAIGSVLWWWLDPACVTCVPSLRHAHEMVLGYAVAVLGGFLFTRMSRPALAGAVLLWLAGRVIALGDASGPLAALGALAFPVLLGILAGLPFIKAARSGRNLAFAPILGGFTLAEALYQLGLLGLLEQGEARGAALALDLVTAMLLVMGGRLIPAAMAGVARAKGDSMADRNGPRLETISVAAMGAAGLSHALALPDLAFAGWAIAGVAALVRMTRWRFRLSLAEASLWPLQVGYGLLGAGLFGSAVMGWSGLWPASAALHAITIGGLGIISATMMVRTVMLRDRPPVGFPAMMKAAVGLLVVATAARLAMPAAPAGLMAAAALAWAAAFALTGWCVVSLTWQARRSRPGPS